MPLLNLQNVTEQTKCGKGVFLRWSSTSSSLTALRALFPCFCFVVLQFQFQWSLSFSSKKKKEKRKKERAFTISLLPFTLAALSFHSPIVWMHHRPHHPLGPIWVPTLVPWHGPPSSLPHRSPLLLLLCKILGFWVLRLMCFWVFFFFLVNCKLHLWSLRLLEFYTQKFQNLDFIP